MNTLNVNITPEEVIAQKTQEATVKFEKKTVFDEKNYLQARLTNGETSKTLTIRLLPFSTDGGTPFHKVHMHQVRVNKAVSSSGWKTFPCPIGNHLGESCPFCETSKEAKRMKESTSIEAEKKKYGDIEFANKSRDMWVTRCIERGHEEDGVKFWLFSSSKKGDGVYDKIMNIFQNRWNKAKEQGKYNNIFDLNNGKDLILTISKDSNNKNVINVTDDDEKTPLSDNYELALSWVNDSKKWEEVFTVKPYDYMAVVMQGGVPKFSKEQNCYIDKTEADRIEAEDIERNLSRSNVDLSVEPQQVETNTNQQPSLSSKIVVDNIEADDLPF